MPAPGGQNHEWNKSQPPGTPPIDAILAGAGSRHPREVQHPSLDERIHGGGEGPVRRQRRQRSYKIENLPPGNYTLTAWQETYGTQTQKITVAAGKPATANFTFKAK